MTKCDYSSTPGRPVCGHPAEAYLRRRWGTVRAVFRCSAHRGTRASDDVPVPADQALELAAVAEVLES